jgi:glycosyltransferase involved in cell wall biosynthesis
VDDRDAVVEGPTPRSALPAHVVIVTPELWGVTKENGGISTSVFHLARLLRGDGDRVTILAGIAKDATTSEPWASRYRDAGIEVRVAVAATRGSDSAPTGLEFPFRRISEAVADELPRDADVVYFQDWSALGYGTLRRRLRDPSPRWPVVVSVLRGSSAWAEGRPDGGHDAGAVEGALAKAEAFAVEHSDFVVAPSRSYRDHYVDQGGRLPSEGRTRLLPHPWLPLGPSADGAVAPATAFRRIVFFGRLEHGKGIDLLLDSLATLASRSVLLRDLDEVLFLGREGRHGRGSVERIGAELTGLGLASRFIVDLDSWEALGLLYELVADSLVVHPSLRENFPNAVLEASLVPGLNAVYSDVGGVGEMLGDEARAQLFSPGVESLAATLETWLGHGPLEQDELVSYDWEAANRGWLAFHRELVSAPGSDRPSAAGARSPRSPQGPVRPGIGVLLSTYEWPDALDAVLRSLADQSDADFELVVADDGSGPETRAVVDSWRHVFGERLEHVWQPDDGYRLARVLDLGVLATTADHLVVLPGDSIPRRHFVQAMRSAAAPGWFVAGRRIDLSPALTGRVLREKLPVHRWSFARWALQARVDAASLKALTPRDRRRVGVAGVPEFDPVDRGFGFLLGVARTDFERVNGYDTRFEGWGEEDVDLAVRLRRSGLRCGHAGPQATLIHLWHESRKVHGRPNWLLLKETERNDRGEAIEGLHELAEGVAEPDVS